MMGLGDADLLDDGGGCKVAAAAVSCSICLEIVTENGDRSWAKLQCGHQFHLDCIGSAFNIKGEMQCPNCRKIEKGQWLYANGSCPLPEFNIGDWTHDEDLNDLSYSEMWHRFREEVNKPVIYQTFCFLKNGFLAVCYRKSVGIHWCPFTSVPSSFDEGEFSLSAYHDLLGHHAVFAEHTPASSTSHPCPYVAYFGPIHPSSSASSGSVSDGSTFHWNGPSVPSEVPNSYPFPSMDLHYHSWDHSSPFPASNRIGGADHHLIPSVNQRTTRNSSHIPRRAGMRPPFILGHRAPSSITSSVLPTLYPGGGTVPRPRDRPSSLQAYFQQSTSNNPPVARTPVISTGSRRSSNSSSSIHRGLAQVAPISATSASNQSCDFCFSSTFFQEAENPHRDLFHNPWERDHHQHLSQVDRDSIWGGPFRSPGAGSDGGIRSGIFRQRMPSQNRS